MRRTWQESYTEPLVTTAIAKSVGDAVEVALDRFLQLLPNEPLVMSNLGIKVDLESIEIREFGGAAIATRGSYVHVELEYVSDSE